MSNKEPKPFFNAKNIIAIGIAGLAVFTILFITIKVLGSNLDEGLDFVAKSVLPLVATWMGAIIAYYFAKDNFDATTEQSDKMIDKLTMEKRLESVKVTDAMIPLSEIQYFSLSDFLEKKIMSEILDNKSMKGLNRFLFFDGKKCEFVIHRSIFDRFITFRLGKEEKGVKELKLKDLIAEKDKAIHDYVHKGISYISQAGCLLDAKKLIDDNKSSEDIIVTRTGKENEDVVGWIPDTLLAEYAKL